MHILKQEYFNVKAGSVGAWSLLGVCIAQMAHISLGGWQIVVHMIAHGVGMRSLW